MLIPEQFNPMLVGKIVNDEKQSVRDVVKFYDNSSAGCEERPRDFRKLVTTTELEKFEAFHSQLDGQSKIDFIESQVLELVKRQLMVEEHFEAEFADQLAEHTADKYGIQLVQCETLAETLLKTASELHFKLFYDMYVTSMELLIDDFEDILPNRGCLYDPEMMFERMKNPEFRPTKEQREAHYLKDREQTFGMMMSFGGYKVKEVAVNPKVEVMMTTTMYRIFQGKFDPETLKNANKAMTDEKVIALPVAKSR